MIANLKPYPAYKDSGVPWLGKVPEHWEVLPNRALFAEGKERTHPDEQMLSVTISKGVIRQQALLSDSSKKDGSNQDKSAYKLVCPRDIAYNKMRAWQGAIGISEFRGIVSPAYVVVRLRNDQDPHYFHHLFRTPMFAKEAERWSYGITSDMWSLRPEHFKMIYTALPPLSEQSAIVRFLVNMERRIRHYIRAKQKLVMLLNEQKQAIIHRAVTRGLDPNVPLKPSGVEWLGDVPAHWEVGRLSRFFTLQRGFDITKDQQREGAVPVVSSGGVSSYHDHATARGPGVLVGRKGTAGAVHDVEREYWAHDTTLWVNDFKGNYPRYVYYILTILNLKRFDTGSANPTLNRNLIHPEQLAFPLASEQTQIASKIDGELEKFTGAVDRAHLGINLLREYRTRLIADVVTGKLDVREAVAKLPDEAEDPDDVGTIDESPLLDEAATLCDAEEETEAVEELEE